MELEGVAYGNSITQYNHTFSLLLVLGETAALVASFRIQ